MDCPLESCTAFMADLPQNRAHIVWRASYTLCKERGWRLNQGRVKEHQDVIDPV